MHKKKDEEYVCGKLWKRTKKFHRWLTNRKKQNFHHQYFWSFYVPLIVLNLCFIFKAKILTFIKSGFHIESINYSFNNSEVYFFL